MTRVALVVNPASGSGRTGRRLQELASAAREVFGQDVTLATSEAHGDGRRVAQEAVAAGAELVIAVGGDGTANEVVDGLMSLDDGRAAFGLVPAGTGSDLARTLAMPRAWDAALRAIRDAAPRRCDVMAGRFTQLDGRQTQRFGINVVGMGMAGDVVRRANEGSKRLGGTATFVRATIASLVAWQPPEVTVSWERDGEDDGTWQGRLVNVFISNARYCGSGMLTGPEAVMDDGLLDVVIIPDRPTWRLVAQTPHLYDGTLHRSDGVLAFRTRRIRAEASPPGKVPSDMDGEQPGGLPAEIACLPGALDVRAPWSV